MSRRGGIPLGKYLFLDDSAIADMQGLKRVFHRPVKHPGNPLVRAEHPWERGLIHPQLVFYDDELSLFHLWYRAVDAPPGTPAGREHTCYAGSHDGVHWEKPVLDLVGYDGNTRNNIIGTRIPHFVMVDRETNDPRRRLLGFWASERPFSFAFRSSADGIRWEDHTEPETGDLRSVAAETGPNPQAKYFTTGQCWSGKNAWGAMKRGVMRCDSDDLVYWGGRRVIFSAGSDEPDNLEFYTMSTATCHRADSYAGYHFGFLHCFHTILTGRRHPQNQVAMSGPIDVYLVTSRDTIDWQWMGRARPFLPLGGEGCFDSGMVFLSSMIAHGDRLLFFYNGWNVEHGQLIGRPETVGRSEIGLASLRLDGFVSLEPARGEGELCTTPLIARGDTLNLNADARSGTVAVEIVAEDRTALAGFGARECQMVQDDSVRKEVTWKSGRTVSDLAGKAVRFGFHLTGQAKLYSFEMTGSHG